MRLDALSIALAPPLCAACGRLAEREEVVCARCARGLAAAGPLRGRGPQGVDLAWSSAAHEGIARSLVISLKFRRVLPVAGLMAERIAWLAPAELLSGELVPVPPAPLRGALRGFDPAAEIAAALAARTGLAPASCLARRGGRRQLGRGRAGRVSNPPAFSCAGRAPRSALLVDDVLTTGATLSACARALREAGAVRVAAVTFARRF